MAWEEAGSILGPPGVQGPEGPQGATGPQGPAGPQGAAGGGVPVGGTAGQLLQKNSSTDYDASWLSTTAFGRGFLALVDAAAALSYIGAQAILALDQWLQWGGNNVIRRRTSGDVEIAGGTIGQIYLSRPLYFGPSWAGGNDGIVVPNAVNITGLDTGGAITQFIRIDASNIIQLGSTGRPINMRGTSITLGTGSGLATLTSGVLSTTPISRLIPAGGTTGQVLMKNSNADYDVSWADVVTPT
jgi:hypothetical protein